MATVALVGFVPSLASVVAAALDEEGLDSVQLPLDADVVRQLKRHPPDALIFDGHAYANTKAFLADLRTQRETAMVPVVVLGPERPAEVPQFEVVYHVGRTLDLNVLLAAVERSLGRLGD